ncbi:ComEA family DNA-binding protein [Isoptericola rhizosphaerae]|uniref:ComEA family DNA-binding protein n=1 Tax=Isoptericola rhizosphaerae TaxID=3377837 RepID=UPI00383B9AD2
MTTSATPRTPDAAARLDALRAALDETVAEPSAPVAAPLPGTDARMAPDVPDPELVERLRSRRSAGHVAAAYSAAHGHPVTADDGGVRRRWALSGPVAVAVCGVTLALALTVAALAYLSGASSEDLGVAVGGPQAGPAEEEAVTDLLAPQPGIVDGSASPAPAAASATAPAAVVVHVTGEVAEPGLVDLPAGARVADAVEGAGGAGDDADLAALNLARAVVDGEQVHVPAPGEDPPAVPAPVPEGSTDGTADGAGGAPVALNTAGAEALTSLPGVGPVIAERIVAWRDEHGPFTRVEELTEISGIGPALLADVRDLVVL